MCRDLLSDELIALLPRVWVAACMEYRQHDDTSLLGKEKNRIRKAADTHTPRFVVYDRETLWMLSSQFDGTINFGNKLFSKAWSALLVP